MSTSTATACRVGLAAQVVFTLTWIVAVIWQPPGYRVLAHTISDMYAVGAPHAWVLIAVFTLTGLATIWFAVFGLRPMLRGTGWTGVLGWVGVAVSILGLGDALSVFEQQGCALADPACTPDLQLANAGGVLDATLSTVGLIVAVAAGFFVAAAFGRSERLRPWSGPVRILAILLAVCFAALPLLPSDLTGLTERAVALAAAVMVSVMAYAGLRAADAQAPESVLESGAGSGLGSARESRPTSSPRSGS